MKLLFLIALLTSTLYSSAQRFHGGLITGLSTSQIDGDTQKDYKKLGFYSGVFVETDFTKVIGAKIELFYIMKGAKKTVNDIEEFRTTLNYIEMPFLLTIKPIDKFEFDIGIAVSYLISAKYRDVLGSTSELNAMHDLDFGGIITGSYFFSEKIAFNVRFEYSLVPARTDPHNWFNSNLSFGLVYKIL